MVAGNAAVHVSNHKPSKNPTVQLSITQLTCPKNHKGGREVWGRKEGRVLGLVGKGEIGVVWEGKGCVETLSSRVCSGEGPKEGV